MTQYVGSLTAMSLGVTAMLDAVGKLKANTPFLRPVFAYLDLEKEDGDGTLKVEPTMDGTYDIEFKNVSFHYPNSDKDVLKNVSIKLEIGKSMAIVGENGSGKITFIKLLCGLYEPTEGEILLNGISIKDYPFQEYVSLFSVIFQDFKLFAFTLGQNVAADAHYDRDKVLKVLEGVGFSERLERLEEGLETYLYRDFAKNEVEVSGGEAQKIAIARALYKDTPFIIMDEPTAALDPVAEHEIYSQFHEIVNGRTALFISHRLSSCRFCDKIAVFADGEIVQYGNHDTLITEENIYAKLWNTQAQYYRE